MIKIKPGFVSNTTGLERLNLKWKNKILIHSMNNVLIIYE